ncbi:MAG: hypothetical protein IPP52_11545 [Ignavibacteria bacterium]|nr:hypothetical protein [Ignavibacteria bacterium]
MSYITEVTGFTLKTLGVHCAFQGAVNNQDLNSSSKRIRSGSVTMTLARETLLLTAAEVDMFIMLMFHLNFSRTSRTFSEYYFLCLLVESP